MACTTEKLRLIFGDVTLGVAGEGFHYIFSYQTGGLESLVCGGREWLYRTAKPTFWRALTDNDRGSKFHLKSGMWMAADAFIGCKDLAVSVDGKRLGKPIAPKSNRFGCDERAERLRIAFTYETLTVPAAQAVVTYDVEAGGRMVVTCAYKGKKRLPQLPVFGLRMIMPTAARGYRYEGLSGETYPDRMAGAVHGVFDVEGLPVTPYLVPQDCGMHMESDWVEVTRDTSLSNADRAHYASHLRIAKVDKPFAFSCLPYTALELENATHQEELPPARRTVLCLYGAARGVGGIDSWGTDVESAYHIDAQGEITFSFAVEP